MVADRRSLQELGDEMAAARAREQARQLATINEELAKPSTSDLVPVSSPPQLYEVELAACDLVFRAKEENIAGELTFQILGWTVNLRPPGAAGQ